MLRRFLTRPILQSLDHFPVVLLTGARQTGKSTLVQALSHSGWKPHYMTLDNRNILDAALRDPDGWLAAQSDPLIIDEVQRAPDLLRAIKLRVDQDRRPGRYVLTGSSHVLTLKTVSETLAGRVAIHELYPFSLAEEKKRPHPLNVRDLFRLDNIRELKTRLPSSKVSNEALHSFILSGGYPSVALNQNAAFRQEWFSSYRTTYVERDVRDIQAIEHLSDFNRLLTLAAARTGQIANLAELGRSVGLPYATLRRYLQILEQTYQLYFVSPYFLNIGKRLTKAPKLYWTDTGMARALQGIESWAELQKLQRDGALLETWAAAELRKALTVSDPSILLYTWRVEQGPEIDFLLNKGSQFVALEVKSASSVPSDAVRNMELLKKDFGHSLRLGIVLYGGTEFVSINPWLAAVPLNQFF